MNRFAKTFLLGSALLLGAATAASADPFPPGWQALNMRPVGYSNLEGRDAFKLAIKRVGDRWYLIMGHLWSDGWSVVDVTNPADPKYLKFIPGPSNTWTIQVTFHDNLLITALQPKVPSWGGVAGAPSAEGFIAWDISDPLNWKQVARWQSGSTGTHRNSYPGGKYAYLSAGAPGYRGHILIIMDVSDPANPKEVGRWSMPGQKDSDPPAEGPQGFHGPANVSPDGKMIAMGYTPAVVNLDISDPANPKLLGKVTFTPPFVSAGIQSIHTVLPLWDRKLLFASSEASASRCDEALNFAGLVDNKDPTKPRLMSLFPLPKPPKGWPYKNFCEKGGRFGPHNVNQEIHLPDVEKPGNLIYLTYFNAGLRVFDIKDPIQPEETGWFIPPQPTRRLGPQPPDALVNQTEDVLVDTRGYVYVDDKHWGLFILKYTGPDQPAPTAR
jgi:hypothetical protein